MRVKPYIRYASRIKMCYDAVDRVFCDAIKSDAAPLYCFGVEVSTTGALRS